MKYSQSAEYVVSETTQSSHRLEREAAPGRILTSAGTLCFNNCRLIGSLKSFIRSAGFNRSQLIGSAEHAQI